MANQEEDGEAPKRDLRKKPKEFLLFWGLPMIILFCTSFLNLPSSLETLIYIITFIWMGSGCLINSRRCGRRHCYYSGPIFLFGAGLIAVLGFGLINFTPDDLTIVIWGTLIAVMLAFVPEYIWGPYRE
jgi:hypothetical protein